MPEQVAVIIPTYNRATWVVEAVESVLAGSLVPDIIVVDDGSTDGTSDVLEARFGARIRVVRQENAERGAARNHGARSADAELLLFLDADDLFEATHVSTLVKLASAHSDVGLFHSRFLDADAQGNPTGNGGGVAGRHGRADFVLGRVQLPPSVMAIRNTHFERVGGFDERRELAGSEDWLLVANALRFGDSLCSEEATVRMRKHDGNSMGNARSMEASMLLAHRLHFAESPGAETPSADREMAVRSRAVLLVNAATTWFTAGEVGQARRCLREAVQCWPGVLLDGRVPTTFFKTLLGTERVEQLKSLLRR